MSGELHSDHLVIRKVHTNHGIPSNNVKLNLIVYICSHLDKIMFLLLHQYAKYKNRNFITNDWLNFAWRHAIAANIKLSHV